VVASFVTVVFWNVVQIVSANNNSSFHFCRLNSSLQKTPTNRYIASEWAFFVDIGSLNRFARSLESKTNTMAEQVEKAYQKQDIFLNAKSRGGKKIATKEKRWYKDVGLGFKTPSEAINGTYIDKKCPFTGDISIRGRILSGKVVSTKMNRTIIIRRDYLHYIPKYNRYEKRHKNLAVHLSPAFRVELGDVVTVGQCRPLSKTVRFNVLRVAKNKAAAKTFGKF